ncbi:hypothetical protein PIB30_037126 [Stylosanthes scabra]|uniref:Uncharacterized protein n=1 Tax=Stylosanthes scabra TaxID=79078 RepID=A0ABU6QDD7_9FABA|nr:hypothetical protein [Stylosanthes scabra]
MVEIQESGDLREHRRSEGTLTGGGFRRLTMEIEQTAAEQGLPAAISSKTAAATRVIEHHQHHHVPLSLSRSRSLSPSFTATAAETTSKTATERPTGTEFHLPPLSMASPATSKR